MMYEIFTCRHCGFEAAYLEAMLKHQAEHHQKPAMANVEYTPCQQNYSGIMNNLYRFFIRYRVCIDSVLLVATAALLGVLVTICYLYLDHDRVCYDVRQEQIAEENRRKAAYAKELAAQNERIEYRKKICGDKSRGRTCRIMSVEWREK